MPKVIQAQNGVWYKKPTDEELAEKKKLQAAVDHAFGNGLPHTIDQIVGADNIKQELGSIVTELQSVKTNLNQKNEDISALQNANARISGLEKKLFYNAWFFKNGTYKSLEFDTFEDNSKLFLGKIEGACLVPEQKCSIYRSIKFIPKLANVISRYMVHVEYEIWDGGGLMVEISFDEGAAFHTILSTVEDTSMAYYYQFPNFCDCEMNVPEIDASSFMVRFRLFANDAGTGVKISSYGVLVSE